MTVSRVRAARWGRLLGFTFLLSLAGCGEQDISPTSLPVVESETAVSIGVIPTIIVQTSPTAEPSPTLTLAPTPPTSTLTLPVPGPEPFDLVPCGVVLPLFTDNSVPETAELPQVEIPDSVPVAARPALERLLEAPETVGLVAYQIGFEANGVYHNPDVPMPLASLIKIITLIAYGEAANEGRFNTADWIPLEEMDRYYLPGTDLGSHRLGIEDLADRNLIAFDPPASPLEEIPWLMMRFSSNAASDYLQLQLGQQRIEETAVALGLTTQTAPCPFIGQFLAMSNHDRPGSDQLALENFLADPAVYGSEVMRLTALYAADETFRQDEIDLRGRSPSLPVQSFFSENLLAKGSANEYAHLMARIFENGLSSPFANILVRRNLEWPMIFEANQEIFTAVGYKNGAFPGVLTTTYYAQRREDGGRIVVALFYRQLPEFLYRSWRRDLAHDEFARWLLSDPQAIQTLNSLLAQ